jgi:hypothetical protein
MTDRWAKTWEADDGSMGWTLNTETEDGEVYAEVSGGKPKPYRWQVGEAAEGGKVIARGTADTLRRAKNQAEDAYDAALGIVEKEAKHLQHGDRAWIQDEWKSVLSVSPVSRFGDEGFERTGEVSVSWAPSGPRNQMTVAWDFPIRVWSNAGLKEEK